MREKGPASARGKNTFAFTQLEVNDHLGGGLSFGIDCEMEIEQEHFYLFFFLELEASIHSYLEEHLCLQKFHKVTLLGQERKKYISLFFL